MRVVDLWVQTTLEEYIIEFVVESHQYFSKVEVVLSWGFWGKLLKEVALWIKVLMMEEGLLVFQNLSMEV